MIEGCSAAFYILQREWTRKLLGCTQMRPYDGAVDPGFLPHQPTDQPDSGITSHCPGALSLFHHKRAPPERDRVELSLFLCRAQSFAERLRLGIAVIHGEAQDAESDQVDGRHSPPTVKTTGAIHPSMEIPCEHSTRSKTKPCP